MEGIKLELRRQYDEWKKKLGADFPDYLRNTVSMDTVLRAHYLLCDYFLHEGEEIAMAGPRNEHLLPSAVGRQFVEFGGCRKWQTDLEVCATLFFGIVKDHPFHDANKRTAFLVAVYHLFANNRIVDSRHKLWDELAIRTAEGKLSQYPQFRKFRKTPDSEVCFIADFFRRNTRKADKRYYIVTYNQLRAILQRFSFDLDEPAGNFIHVIRKRTIRKGLLRSRVVEERQKVLKIGFPGWGREVSRRDLKQVRKVTCLTPEHDVDSLVFFKGADPLEALIPRYHGVLTRLRDK